MSSLININDKDLFFNSLYFNKRIFVDTRNDFSWFYNNIEDAYKIFLSNKNSKYLSKLNDLNCLEIGMLRYTFDKSIEGKYIETFLESNNLPLYSEPKEDIDFIYPLDSDVYHWIEDFLNHEILFLKLEQFILLANGDVLEGVKKYYFFKLNLCKFCGFNYDTVEKAFAFLDSTEYSFLPRYFRYYEVKKAIKSLEDSMPYEYKDVFNKDYEQTPSMVRLCEKYESFSKNSIINEFFRTSSRI